MPSIFGRVLLFLSSYFPLDLIFFFLVWPQNHVLALGFLTVGFIGVAGLLVYYTLVIAHSAVVQIQVDELQRKDSDTINYLAAYAIPFVALPVDHIEKYLALATFFLVMAILYVQSNMIHINPILSIVGFHLYEVRLDSGTSSLSSEL